MKKISINFNLHDRQKAKSSIIMSVAWDGLRYQTSIGVSVNCSQFDLARGKIKNGAEFAMENNQYMDYISQEIKNYFFANMANNHVITKDEMKSFIQTLLEKKITPVVEEPITIEKTYTLFELFDLFISIRENNPKYGKRVIQGYKTIKKHLQDYEKYTKTEFDFASINSEFADRLVLYLAQKKNLVNSTIDKVIRTFKVFLNWAFDNDYTKDLKWKRVFADVTKDFKLNTESSRIVLNQNEIALFENYAPNSELLHRIRDLFLIHIYTGLRVSDLMTLKPKYIFLDEGKIVLYQEKTDSKVVIPIHAKLKNILSKYPNLQIPSFTDQFYNKYLKVLGKEVGLNGRVILTYFYGKKKVETSYEKWELLTSHVARDTCITYLIKKGLIPEYVMKISGHKSRSAFQTYVKIAQDEAQIAVKNAWEE